MTTRSVASPLSSTGVSEIFCATSSPSTTRANTVYFPSSDGWALMHMKNWVPALSGLPGTCTAATAPFVSSSSVISVFSLFSPPDPYLSRAAGSFVTGSPP